MRAVLIIAGAVIISTLASVTWRILAAGLGLSDYNVTWWAGCISGSINTLACYFAFRPTPPQTLQGKGDDHG